MNRYTNQGITKKLLTFIGAIFFIAIIFSCNKDFPNRLNPSDTNDTLGVNTRTRKVLYIIVDGVRGQAIKALNPPNLTQIFKKSIYAYDALSDFDTNPLTNAGAWANMLTGVTKSKHAVITEDFSGSQINNFPTVFSRLKQFNANARTVSIAASASFNANLATDATVTKTMDNNDEAVKTEVVNELTNNDANLVVAQFHSAEAVGKTDGYTQTTATYNDAILKVDGYIGEVMSALTKRKTFFKENWLVIIASNKGGAIPAVPGGAVDATSYGDATRNNFIVFYNPRFSTLFLPKPASDQIPYVGSALHFVGNDGTISRATVPVTVDGGLYNFGSTGDFTVSVKARVNNGAEYYPPILGKRATFSGNSAGWLFFLEGDLWMCNISAGSGNTQAKGTNIRDGIWHDLTAKFYMVGTARKLSVYTDGVLNETRDITSKNINSPAAPLTLGYITGSGGSIDVLLKDFRIYNVAIPDNLISAYSRKTMVDSSNPYYNNLIGYWPIDEGTGNTVLNRAPIASGKNFTMSGNATWSAFSDYSPNIDAPVSNEFFKIVPNNVDIPVEIYQWLGINIYDLGLDGKTWNPIYSDLKP